jgi:hypothetical protein
MPSKWLLLGGALVLACALAFAGGYRAGYGRADDARRAEVAELNTKLETWKEEQAKAWAEAERLARQETEAATRRANALAAKLDGTKRETAAKIRDITRRIPHATAGNDCDFSDEFVRLYNEAIGCAAGGSGGGAVPQADDPAGTAGTPGSAPAAGAGVRPVRAVKPADILAHIRDFGARSQAVTAQVNALIDLVGER